ncbi:MAG TPA: hypothetical protein VJT75_11735 [Thermoleophilaceae bacterium]|nr:hypothetical protein [Thermoleophilaceae bacterium]
MRGESSPVNMAPRLARAFRRWAKNITVEATPAVPGADAAERRLLGALGGVAAVVGQAHVGRWPEEVREWALSAPTPPDDVIDLVRDGLGGWRDPLAVLYDASISPSNRRRLGTVFTPEPIVEHMLDLVDLKLNGPPACVIDPGAGSGAFTIAAARRWPRARVIAVDVNVVTLGLLAARITFEAEAEPLDAATLERVELVLGDYLAQLDELYAEGAAVPVVALGNPPYTRVQELPFEDRRKAADAASGVIDSGHANLAMLFLAATLKRMRSDDLCCMVVPGSFSYTRASRGLRRTLWESRRAVRVERTPATTRAFTGRSVQAAIVLVGPELERRSPLQLARVELHNPSIEVQQSWALSRTEPEPANWFWPKTPIHPDGETVPLSEIAVVRRGVATGAKEMFFLTDSVADSLPGEVLAPGILTLRGFDGERLTVKTHRTYGDASTRRWLLTIPPDYELSDYVLEYVRKWAPLVKARFLPSQREPWYVLTNLLRPQLLISPLAKSDFRVVVNEAQAIPSNNLFGITLKSGGDPASVARWLRSEAGQAELHQVSRRYHGGSHKLEPGSLRTVRVPKNPQLAD